MTIQWPVSYTHLILLEKWNSLTNPHQKAGIKYIVRRMLMKSYFQHIERELSVTKNTDVYKRQVTRDILIMLI